MRGQKSEDTAYHCLCKVLCPDALKSPGLKQAGVKNPLMLLDD